MIVATSTADLTFPSAATMVQNALGMTRGFAFDVQAVCAGFVFALSTANGMILSGPGRRVLVIGAETFSRILDWTDRGTCVLFGDGAGALVLEARRRRGHRPIAASLRPTCIPTGGSATSFTSMAACPRRHRHLRMQGKEVFRHAVEKLADTAHRALDKAGLGPRRRLDRAASGQPADHQGHRAEAGILAWTAW